ncbi:MAG: hypothetical protein RIQ47_361, partial [Bacteroidota bacterium]
MNKILQFCYKIENIISIYKHKNHLRKNHRIAKELPMRNQSCITVHFFLFTLFLLCCQTINAQNGFLKGLITAENKSAIAGVSISIRDSIGTNSNANGEYSLSIPAGKHNVQFRLISYRTETRIVEIKPGETTVLNISLLDESRELGTVVISASKFEQRIEEVTVSMEVLKPYLIENTVASSADQALDQVPGVSVVDGQANIRGGSGWSYGAGSRVQVMVDDLPLLAADAGDAKWSFIPLENIEQAEVVKGASSVLFGSSALNGTINFRTKYPVDKPVTKISLFRGVYDNASHTLNDTTYSLNEWKSDLQGYTGLSALHTRKAGQFDIVVGANYFNDAGYRLDEYEERLRVN